MIKLYGLPVSNYYNVVKLAMLEKGVDFEEVRQSPSQDETYLAVSPMGRMPAVVTPQGALCETLAILEYLEKAYPQPPLYPSDPFLAARAMQVHCFVNNYLDAVIRPHITSAFFGAPRDEDAIAQMNSKLAQGCSGLARIVDFAPFVVGEQMTHADLAVVNTVVLASSVPRKLEQPDPVMEIPGLSEYLARMEQNPNLQRVRADAAASLKALLGQA